MILCLDIGNSHICGGVFIDKKRLLQFRYPSEEKHSSDQLGLFFRQVLAENKLDPNAVKQIGLCSVVPSLDYTIRSAFIKYFGITPFILKPGVKTGLKIKSKNPPEIGSDRIANSIGAIHLFPNKNCIIIDFGTATTFDVVNEKTEYLGGAILPGINISMQALHTNTAKLSPVSIIKPQNAIGQTTASNIQSGLYHGHVGAIKQLLFRFKKEAFSPEAELTIIGTGGFAHLFNDENLFTDIIPDLSLQGIQLALIKNKTI